MHCAIRPLLATVLFAVPCLAQEAPTTGPKPDRVQVLPATADGEVGPTLRFSAVAFDAAGTRMDVKPTAWVAAPFDSGGADENGVVTLYAPGELRVGA